jgi:hypothetical protein
MDYTRGSGRRLGVSAMAITKFCRRSMPHRMSDGNVCWPDALLVGLVPRSAPIRQLARPSSRLQNDSAIAGTSTSGG